eukprot:364347-Chlamydomonas_euryale.AAC.4
MHEGKSHCSPPRPAQPRRRGDPRIERSPTQPAPSVVVPRGLQPQISERGPGTVPSPQPPPRPVLRPGRVGEPAVVAQVSQTPLRQVGVEWPRPRALVELLFGRGAGPKGDALHPPQEAVVRRPERAPLLSAQSPHLRHRVGEV